MFSSFLSSKKFKVTLAIAVGLYVLLLMGFYIFSNRIIFQGTSLPPAYSFEFQQPYTEYFIKISDGTKLNALLFKTSIPSKGLIFYAHGNSDNLARWGQYAVDFTSLGYDVFMYDYRSYGKSNGKPSIGNLQTDAAEVLNWVKTNLTYSRLIIYGRSLGSTVGTELASRIHPDLLLLETPFAELKDVIYWPIKPALYFLPKTLQLNNILPLSRVACKKIIFHGTQDWVVPLSSPLKLKPLLDRDEDFIVIEGAGHKNLRDFAEYHKQLARVLQ